MIRKSKYNIVFFWTRGIPDYNVGIISDDIDNIKKIL